MGKTLPPLRSAELFSDEEHTQIVNPEDFQHGDIAFFTTSEPRNSRFFHVGIISIIDGVPHITHNARHIGFAITQSLEEITKHPLYEKIAAIKRPIIPNPNGQNIDFLVTYGFEHLA